MFEPTPVPASLSFACIRRIHVRDLTEADVDHLFGGPTPLVVEGLDEGWPEEFRNGGIRELAAFRKGKPNSVFVDGKQVFGIDRERFLAEVEANRNVRVFGVGMKPHVDAALRSPATLFDRLDALSLYRYGEKRPICFVGGGGAITPLHYDFESNINWHIVMAGERPVYLWHPDQSPRLFKLPIIGLSLVSFSAGMLDHRFAKGQAAVLKKGDLLYMPAGWWHQIEYPTPSMAATFAFFASATDKARGETVGHFWLGLMSLFQAVAALRLRAYLVLPLLLPFALFGTIFVPGRYAASFLPGRAGAVVGRVLRAGEDAAFRMYAPLMEYCRKAFWVGY